MRGKRLISKLCWSVVLVVVASFISFPSSVFAAQLTTASDTISTILESVVANHTIQFVTPTGVAAAGTITVTFPTGFSLPAPMDYTDMDLAYAATCGAAADQTLAATPSGATWGAAKSGQIVTFTSGTGTVGAGNCVIIEIGTNATSGVTGDQQITNQTAVQNNSDPKIVLTAGASDSATIAVEIVADNTTTVNATVDPSITCAFVGMTTTFSSLTTGAVSTSDTNTSITISTNASNGFNLSIYDAGNATNPGLYKSSATTYLIGSADSSYANTATLANGVDGFGIQGATSGGSGGTVTIDARYNQSGNVVGGLEVGAAAAVTLATATQPVANRAVTVTHKAAVSGLAPAGSYTDTLTYTCTGIY